MSASRKRGRAESKQAGSNKRRSTQSLLANPGAGMKGTHLVMSFGSGDMGQLGLGMEFHMRERKKPTIVQPLQGSDVVQVSAGGMHNAVLTRDGKVYTWGVNDDGALGREGDEFSPLPVAFPGEENVVVHKVCCGASHTLALDTDGRVWTWGCYRDLKGMMGFSSEKVTDRYEDRQTAPKLVPGLTQYQCVDIACGDHHDLALTSSGAVFQWGDVGVGKRLSERNKRLRLSPHRVLLKGVRKTTGLAKQLRGVVRGGTQRIPAKQLRVTSVFAGGSSSFALTAAGVLYSWGPNNYGQSLVPRTSYDAAMTRKDDFKKAPPALKQAFQLASKTRGIAGANTELFVVTPTPVFALLGVTVEHVAASTHHTLVLDDQGCLWAVGKNDDGRLGLGNRAHSDVIQRVSLPSEVQGNVASVDVGSDHSLLVTRSGQLFSWGFGILLQLGSGLEEDIVTPTQVTSKQITTIPRRVVAAAGGGQHTVILTENPDISE